MKKQLLIATAIAFLGVGCKQLADPAPLADTSVQNLSTTKVSIRETERSLAVLDRVMARREVALWRQQHQDLDLAGFKALEQPGEGEGIEVPYADGSGKVLIMLRDQATPTKVSIQEIP
jgi:hypothetical protein